MRTFLALELPGGFSDDVRALSRALERELTGRFLSPQTYHLTLAFLGEIGEAQSRRVISALDAACSGTGPLKLSSTGLGKFGRGGDATLWLGVERTPELMGLAERVRHELDAREIGYDAKPFAPHITLARHVKIPKGEMPDLPFPADDIARDVTFFKSILERTGATYKPLYTVTL